MKSGGYKLTNREGLVWVGKDAEGRKRRRLGLKPEKD